MTTNPKTLEADLARIPHKLWSIFLPQLRQFGAHTVPMPFGVAAHLNGTAASGWFWACAIDDDCLVTTMHLVTRRPFVLREAPDVDYYVLGMLSSVDTGLVNTMRRERRDAGSNTFDGAFLPSLERNALAFSMRRGPREFEMPAGSLHDSCNICMLPSFLERVGVLLGDAAPCLTPAFEQGTNLNKSNRLLKIMHAIDPTGATRAGAALHYRALVLDALAEMASHLHESERGYSQEQLRADEHIADTVSAALLASLADPPSLNELAERLYLGRTRLCQRFREETGMSIGEHLSRLRLAEAKRRLERSDEAIADIAHALGYAHASSFSTMFLRHEGMGPAAWRAAHRR